MEIIEIVLLILGIIVFIVSYFIPDKKDEMTSGGLSEEEIRKLVRDEYEQSKEKADNLTDETISYTMEKAERQLERITNEKMMAMGEYSDTILNQISKNHQEVVFLSDMLNNNKNDLTVFLGQAIQDAKEANSLAQEAVENSKKASDDAKVAYEKSVTAMDNSVVAEDNMLNARRIIQGEEKKVPKSPNLDDIIPEFDTYEPPAILGDKSAETKKADDAEAKEVDKSKDSDKADVKEAVKESKKTKTKESSKTKIGKKAQAENMPSFKFDMGNASPGNNNEKILKLHNQGKSNVAIAKELGLGVGEVKLVIDLFK
ncbi:MAG: DUF6115 domain-containing protein [Lachnospiraceae bacterium]|nr:DUF6115 domain-containing protein [Lachnospiraceae bacterium]